MLKNCLVLIFMFVLNLKKNKILIFLNPIKFEITFAQILLQLCPNSAQF